MIIRKLDDYFLIKISKSEVGDLNIFDMDNIKSLFKIIFTKLKKKYSLHGQIDAEVYVNNNYGLIIELYLIDDFFEGIDIRIKMHLNSLFLVNIDCYNILDYDDVYYYDGKFYGTYLENTDSNIIYKKTEKIIKDGIKVC